MINEIKDSNFKNEVSSGTVVVDFWAPWCGPCKMLGPVMEELSENLDGKAKFVKVNVDKNPVTSSHYKISSIPTVIVFKDGAVVETLVGFRPKAVIREEIDKYI
jgi:thioredoxin 1